MMGSSPIHDPSHPYDLSSPTGEASRNQTEALSRQSEEQGEPETQTSSYIASNWPSLPLPSESDSPIQPGQGTKSPSPVRTPWNVQQKDPEEYEKGRVGKYAQYFKGIEILPILEILEKLEPRILLPVVTDLKTRRLVRLEK